MKAAGIIAEYNPFHSGHSYLAAKTRELSGAEVLVSVMSGNFVQGGEPACLDKWVRAKHAVMQGGVDVVFELPVYYALGSAELFAEGGTAILRGLGMDFLAFGSESGVLSELEEAASFLSEEDGEFKEALKDALSEGLSFPAARARALSASAGGEKGKRLSALIEEPNNILAVEYLKQLIVHEDSMQPLTVKRKGAYYGAEDISGGKANADSYEPCFSSASAIRLAAKEGRLSELEKPGMLHRETVEELKNAELKTLELRFFEALRTAVLRSRVSELSGIRGASEGLENKLHEAVRKSGDLEELIAALKSKRYTRTAIKRFLCCVLLGIKSDMLSGSLVPAALEMPCYARLLAFNERGAKWLRYIKDNERADIAVISNINKEMPEDSALRELLSLDIAASDIYTGLLLFSWLIV